jgi:hypothetical protein
VRTVALESPSPEVVTLLDQILVKFMRKVISEASRRAMRRDLKPGNLTASDLIYVVKDNRKMHNKIAKFLLISDLMENIRDGDERKEKGRGREKETKEASRGELSEEELR